MDLGRLKEIVMENNMNISEPYKRVICVSFLGKVCDGEPGYELPKNDPYLKLLETQVAGFLRDNYWEGLKVQGYEIIKVETTHPGSSNYENSLEFLIGFRDDCSCFRFQQMMEGFVV